MRERGNILFLILLAVVLFAALSYAVTRGERGQVKSISEEKAASYASVLLQRGALIENTVHRMLANGVPPLQLSWQDPAGGSTADPNTSCTSNACRVYYSGGGGIESLPVPLEATDPDASASWKLSTGEGSMGTTIVSIAGVGSGLPDAVLLWRSVRREVCDAINIAEGIYKKGDAMLNDNISGSSQSGFEGAMTDWPVLPADVFGNGDPRIKGHRVFCVPRNSTYYFYYTVYVR